MIIRATFIDGSRMLFGDSYRTWDDQLAEYCRTFTVKPAVLEMCRSEWIGFGGLKWCSWDNFQEELNKEGKGRRVDYFHFRRAPWFVLKRWKRIAPAAALAS